MKILLRIGNLVFILRTIGTPRQWIVDALGFITVIILFILLFIVL